MGRWKHSYDGGVEIRGLKRASFQDITIAHNADCDAYEARIAELEAIKAEYETECYALRAVTAEANADILRKRNKKLTAELARVKAESLRVVPVGDAYWSCNLCDGKGGWNRAPDWEQEECPQCKGQGRVRLERWEDTHDTH